MSLLSQLNSIVDDRRRENDLAGNEPSVPPAPAQYVVAPPKRAKGGSPAYALVALSPPAPVTLNQGIQSAVYYSQLSATTAPAYGHVAAPSGQTSLAGPDVNSVGSYPDLSNPNPYLPVS